MLQRKITLYLNWQTKKMFPRMFNYSFEISAETGNQAFQLLFEVCTIFSLHVHIQLFCENTNSRIITCKNEFFLESVFSNEQERIIYFGSVFYVFAAFTFFDVSAAFIIFVLVTKTPCFACNWHLRMFYFFWRRSFKFREQRPRNARVLLVAQNWSNSLTKRFQQSFFRFLLNFFPIISDSGIEKSNALWRWDRPKSFCASKYVLTAKILKPLIFWKDTQL